MMTGRLSKTVDGQKMSAGPSMIGGIPTTASDRTTTTESSIVAKTKTIRTPTTSGEIARQTATSRSRRSLSARNR